MEWEAGIIDQMESLQVVYSLMRDYYHQANSNLGKFKKDRTVSEVDVVVGVLKILSEEGE